MRVARVGRHRGRAVESGVGVVRWKCCEGPGARAGAAPGVGDGGVPTLVAGARREGVRVGLFSAELSVNRWVRRVEYVDTWVGARFDDKKGREQAARGQQRAGAAHGGGPPSPRSPLPTLPLWSESSIASLQLLTAVHVT